MSTCPTCKTETSNPKFCSRSCAAKWNNTHYVKRTKKPTYCKVCSAEVWNRKTYCNKCNDEHNQNDIDWSTVTYGEIKGRAKYQKNARIRSQARRTYNHLTICEKCGYNKHVHYHHIKDISTFPDDAFVSDINCRENIMILCPNCHWEEHQLP